eukprot:CAMPEP_0114044660 /NCGR_PEP_ID=MMETSP1339-20121228/7510_1 /TAXON_ID=94617 /ORGANISM="Fibrocapsa japonica" /LENGTH=38 /assembly_acc=CAM_ASM_000762
MLGAGAADRAQVELMPHPKCQACAFMQKALQRLLGPDI